MNSSSSLERTKLYDSSFNLSNQTLRASTDYLQGLTTYKEYTSRINEKDKDKFSSLLTAKRLTKSCQKVRIKRKRSTIPPFVYDFLDRQKPILRNLNTKTLNHSSSRPKSLPKLREKHEDKAKALRQSELPRLHYESFKDLHSSGIKFNEKMRSKETIPNNLLYKPYTVEISPRSKMTIYSSSPIPRSLSALRYHKYFENQDASISPRRSLSPDKLFTNVKKPDRSSFIIHNRSKFNIDFIKT